MYEEFYGLTRNPFGLAPDPRFYCPTPKHIEALVSLSQGIVGRRGIIVMTGEAGTGKTLLVRHVVEALIKRRIPHACNFTPRFCAADLLPQILAEFGVGGSLAGRAEMLARFHRFLMDVRRRGLTAALLIDEAHQLSGEVLEEMRLLLTDEAASILQIVLVGQPPLDLLLDSPALRGLKEKVGLHCRLQPLGRTEGQQYIYRHLQLAGARDRATRIFTPEAIEDVVYYSGAFRA